MVSSARYQNRRVLCVIRERPSRRDVARVKQDRSKGSRAFFHGIPGPMTHSFHWAPLPHHLSPRIKSSPSGQLPAQRSQIKLLVSEYARLPLKLNSDLKMQNDGYSVRKDLSY